MNIRYLKEENQLEWVCRVQNIEARAREIVTTELINNNTVIKILTFLEQKSIIIQNY